MKEVRHVNVNRFGPGVLVEVIGTDEHDDIETRSYEFEFEHDDPKSVHPRGPFPTAYEGPIRETLTAEGYTVADE